MKTFCFLLSAFCFLLATGTVRSQVPNPPLSFPEIIYRDPCAPYGYTTTGPNYYGAATLVMTTNPPAPGATIPSFTQEFDVNDRSGNRIAKVRATQSFYGKPTFEVIQVYISGGVASIDFSDAGYTAGTIFDQYSEVIANSLVATLLFCNVGDTVVAAYVMGSASATVKVRINVQNDDIVEEHTGEYSYMEYFEQQKAFYVLDIPPP